MNKRTLKIVGYAGLFLFTVVYIIIALGYEFGAKLMPIIIAIPTAIMFAILFVQSLKGKDGKEKKKEEGKGEHGDKRPVDNKKVYQVYASLVVFIALSYLFGSLVAIPIYMLGFLVFISKIKVIRSLIFTTLFTSAIYLVFIVLLNARLYKGILM